MSELKTTIGDPPAPLWYQLGFKPLVAGNRFIVCPKCGALTTGLTDAWQDHMGWHMSDGSGWNYRAF